MSVTGNVHGLTPGSTRLIAMPDIIKWHDIRDPNWNGADCDMILAVSATAIVMEVGRHFYNMTSTVEVPYMKELQDVLDKYDKVKTDMKENYKSEIQKNPEFNEYGWILSSYCTDNFDGKQMTSAT